jgi:hypothetical protein
MANQEHLDILKQGVEIWNQWRQENPSIQPDLSYADFLYGTSNLDSVNLSSANLVGATLIRTGLGGADLSRASLNWAILDGAYLVRADLSGADLSSANLASAFLVEADLRDVNMSGVQLRYADLRGANLEGALLNGTSLGGIDLRTTRGLTKIRHDGPSHLDLYTIQLPQDGSALHFLRGVGVPDEWIDFYRATMMMPILYHSCFISYAHQDETPARRLHADLQDRGVRCWFAPEDMKIGDKIRARIDEAIYLQDKLLLLLSKHSLASAWVEDEVEAALEKEQRQQRKVLFPVRLDESVMQTSEAWAAKLRRTRHIGNFTNWTDPQAYQQAFDRLLRDLKANAE